MSENRPNTQSVIIDEQHRNDVVNLTTVFRLGILYTLVIPFEFAQSCISQTKAKLFLFQGDANKTLMEQTLGRQQVWWWITVFESLYQSVCILSSPYCD